MDEQQQQQLAKGIIIAALIAPIIVFLTMPEYGTLAVICGLLTALGAAISMRDRDIDDVFRNERDLSSYEVKGKTIFVQLVDDHGNELDPATAQRRLDEARLNAGPKDTVIGVKRKVIS